MQDITWFPGQNHLFPNTLTTDKQFPEFVTPTNFMTLNIAECSSQKYLALSRDKTSKDLLSFKEGHFRRQQTLPEHLKRLTINTTANWEACVQRMTSWITEAKQLVHVHPGSSDSSHRPLLCPCRGTARPAKLVSIYLPEQGKLKGLSWHKAGGDVTPGEVRWPSEGSTRTWASTTSPPELPGLPTHTQPGKGSVPQQANL